VRIALFTFLLLASVGAGIGHVATAPAQPSGSPQLQVEDRAGTVRVKL
jgi:hypothetical protein